MATKKAKTIEQPKAKAVDKVKKEHKASAYGSAVEVMCTNPDISLEDLRKALTKRGIDIAASKSAIMTGYSQTRKIAALFRQNKLMK